MKFIKKHYKLIIFLLICFLIFTIYKSNNKNNINYTALGDGFAKGINSFGGTDYGYSDYLKDYLKENEKLNYFTKNYTKEDMSIKMLHSCILTNDKETLKDQKFNIRQLLRESELITISIGLNDLIYKLSINTNPSEYKLNQIIKEIELSFDELIKEIRKYYQYDIYVIGYYNINYNNNYFEEAIKKLNKIYQQKEGIIYISTSKIFKNNPSYLSNPSSIYPNTKGYKAITAEIINEMNKKP